MLFRSYKITKRRNRKIKNKEYKLPLVIPIVLYTGKKKWDAKRYLEESQETLDGVKIKAGNYNLVDINDFTKEELLQEKTLKDTMKHGGCGECQTSCQSACKTSCTVGNQNCENNNQ